MGKRILVLVILLAICSSVFCFQFFAFGDSKYISSQSKEKLIPEEVNSGQDFKVASGECPCRFTVETLEGVNFYIYMKDQDGDNDFSFYVEGGQTEVKQVPLGNYKIFYCSGEEWYGVENKFGRRTNMQTSDIVLAFTSSQQGNQINYWGHTVKLYPVLNGNLPTRTIGPNAFPK